MNNRRRRGAKAKRALKKQERDRTNALQSRWVSFSDSSSRMIEKHRASLEKLGQ